MNKKKIFKNTLFALIIVILGIISFPLVMGLVFILPAAIKSPTLLFLELEEPYSYQLEVHFKISNEEGNFIKTISCKQERYFSAKNMGWNIRWKNEGVRPSEYEIVENKGTIQLSNLKCLDKNEVKQQELDFIFWPKQYSSIHTSSINHIKYLKEEGKLNKDYNVIFEGKEFSIESYTIEFL